MCRLRWFGCGHTTCYVNIPIFSYVYLLTVATVQSSIYCHRCAIFTQSSILCLPVSSHCSALQYTVFTDSSLAHITNGRPQRRCTANSQASLNVPIALPAKTRQRKSSTTIEDIYLNRLWRSQMPKEKALESILESPSEQHGGKPTKRLRCLKFDDAPNKTKLRQRRQKAVRNGWKPLTKKQNALLDSQLACKIATIDSDFLEENPENRNDSCLPVEKATLQQHDANMPSEVSTFASATTDCVVNVADRMSELLGSFQHDSCTRQVKIDAPSNVDVGVNLLQMEKNVVTEDFDENRNTVNDSLSEKDQVKLKLQKSNATLCQEARDLTPSNTDNRDQCNLNNDISPPTAECFPSSVEENISACQQQKKLVLKQDRQSKSQCVMAGMHLILEQQNEKHVCSEPEVLSAVEVREKCAETTPVQLRGIDKALNYFCYYSRSM